MDLITAIRSRKSIRGYTSEPVPREIIEAILNLTVRAPSAMNSQPWEFTVITGEALDAIKQENIHNLRNGVPGKPEHLIAIWPKESIYRDRQVGLAKELFALMAIEREDMEKRIAWLERGFRFFDAPVAIVITFDRVLGDEGPLTDIGAAMQTLCLAAVEYRLGTCIEDQGVMYPDVIRKHTGIPDSKKIAVAIALGYPDPDFPANAVETDRAGVGQNTNWVGY